MIAPASADENSIISGCARCSATRKVVMTATSATPPARPSSPSIRLSALMTPTIQNIVNGRLAQPSAIGSPSGLAIASMRKPEPVEQARDRELDEELLPRVRAAQVVVEAERRDRQAAHEQADDVLALGEEQRADLGLEESRPTSGV